MSNDDIETEATAAQEYADPRRPGMPEGISPEGAELRSRIAAVLTRAAFPGSREQLVAHAEAEAPGEEAVLGALRRLPSGQYDRVQAVADALGLGHERRPE